MLRMVGSLYFFPAMLATIHMPPVFPHPHMHRYNVFLDLFFDFDGFPKGVVTVGTFVQGFFNDFVNMIRYSPGHPNMPKLLPRTLLAFLYRIGLRKLCCPLSLLSFELFFQFANFVL